MKDSEKRIEQVRHRSVSGAIRIGSAEGHGVGRSSRGADDARRLASEAATRALKVTRTGRTKPA